eukprot:4441692-Lingulodinium_polyedra.AAC.1
MSSAASSSVNYVDTVEALLFLMADEESSEGDPNFWTVRLANANRSKEGKGSYLPKAPFNAFPSKAPFPKLTGTVGPPWSGGKGAYAKWLQPKPYGNGPPVYPQPSAA